MINNKKVLVLGLGRSGMAAIRLAKENGFEVFWYDDMPERISDEEMQYLKTRGISRIKIIEEVMRLGEVTCVVSPGVPFRNPRFDPLRFNNVISEVQFAWNWMSGLSLAVTGTNGKSTTVALMEHLLSRMGFPSVACGNFGIPLSDVIRNPKYNGHAKVVELSSFQMENTSNVDPDAAVCLSITENHLNRYDSFDDYENAKLRLFRNNALNAPWILDSSIISKNPDLKKHGFLTRVYDSHTEGYVNLEFGANGISGDIDFSLNWNEYFMRCHNRKNVLLALAGILSAFKCKEINGFRLEKESFTSFEPLPFRQENVYEDSGTIVINDSKSSSSDAVIKALEACCGELVLIMGGRNKSISFQDLKRYLEKKPVKVVVYGESRKEIFNLFYKITPVKETETLEGAVSEALNWREKERIILFSPGCESFDQFSGYMERGRVFNELIKKKLKTKKNNQKEGNVMNEAKKVLWILVLGLIMITSIGTGVSYAWTTKIDRFVQHTVKTGDTLEKLAALYGTSIRKILAENKELKSDSLSEGQKIVIPVNGYQKKLIL